MICTPATNDGFRDAHKGETLWVLASGASLDYIDRAFWDDKVCVCVNKVGLTLGLIDFYTVTHYWLDAIIVGEQYRDQPIIVPVDNLVTTGPEVAPYEPTDANVYKFKTGPQRYAAFDPAAHWPQDPDTLVVGPTSLHMTMHFAAYLGAATIILVGADCGQLGGHSNFTGYTVGDNPMDVWQRTLPGVADELRKRGTAVHSLNPFVNFALEGTSFHSPAVRIN